MKKRGISTVVATVLIILITVAAVTIIWTAVIPLIRKSIDSGIACLSADVYIDSKGTCFDEENSVLKVAVKKGAGESDISSIDFILSSGGESTKLTEDFGGGPNSRKTFSFPISDSPEEVGIAPIIQVGDGEFVCDITSSVEIKNCGLEGGGDEDEPKDPNLMLYLNFDEVETNTFGRWVVDADGDIYGELIGDVQLVDGIKGNALDFDGVDDEVILDTSLSNFGDVDYTLMAWIKLSGINSGNTYRVILRQGNHYPFGYGFRIGERVNPSSSKLFFFYGDDDSWEEYTSNTILGDGNWYHVAVTYISSNNAVQLYLNGVAEGGKTLGDLGNQREDSDSGLSIGESYANPGRRFKGIIDEVKIWNRALSAEEISQIYNNS